eukprot:gene25744-34321_t
MGKKDFESKVLSRLGGKFTCKVSFFSDEFNPNARYAGIIIYHMKDALAWKNAKGHNSRGCYVLIQNTDKWPAGSVHDRAGQGRVHDYLYQYITGEEHTSRSACCGGFAVDKGETKYSSVWLNMTTNSSCSYPWESDGDKNLCAKERQIVDKAVNEWKKRGRNIVVQL